MNILLTGGAGYIGSHICVKLIEKNITPIVIDNFSNSLPSIFNNIKEITKDINGIEPILYKGDVRDRELLKLIFREHKIYGVIHLAGFKCVGESVKNPYAYYHNNIVSTLSLLEVMEEYNCYNLVFSSSCTVYGNPDIIPVSEDCNTLVQTSPYGRTKYIQEQILKDIIISNPKWNITSLRYFNPIGSHKSGLIGDLPIGIPNTLMAYLTGVVTGKYKELSVFGNDYNTIDGTCIRDYIHIEDLADVHIISLLNGYGYNVYNIGTGVGTSVLQLIDIFEKATGEKVNYKIVDRRKGDVEKIYCSADLVLSKFGWKPIHTLEEACVSALKFAKFIKNKLK